MLEINNVYVALSPENLSCDGEASQTYIRKKRGELWNKLVILEDELGRKVHEDESWKWWKEIGSKLNGS
jgi:hypothetical protein